MMSSTTAGSGAPAEMSLSTLLNTTANNTNALNTSGDSLASQPVHGVGAVAVNMSTEAAAGTPTVGGQVRMCDSAR